MEKFHFSANTATDFVMSVVFPYEMKNTLLNHRFLILAALAAALPLANSANAEDPAAPAALAETVAAKTASTILQKAEYNSQLFGDVVKDLSNRSGLNIVVQPSLAQGAVIRMNAKDASALCILYALAGDLNAKIVEERSSEDARVFSYKVVGQDHPSAEFDPDPIDYDMIDGGARIKQNKARAGIKILPSIEMNGGVTFSELIDFLNLKTDGNFFVGAELGAVELPDIKMQNVSAFDVIDVMSSTLNIPVTIRWISSGEQGSKDIRWVKKDAVPQPDKNAGAAPITKKMRVYNLRGMEIDGEKDLDKMMKALSDVLLNGVRNPRYWERKVGENPSLELHKATKLLFVTAREDDFDILDQIITALGGKTAEGTVATPASETVKEKQ